MHTKQGKGCIKPPKYTCQKTGFFVMIENNALATLLTLFFENSFFWKKFILNNFSMKKLLYGCWKNFLFAKILLKKNFCMKI